MLRIAWYPAIKMIRFTTVATTGRLMKRSVKFILPPPFCLSAVRRSRRQLTLRFDVVVHRDMQTVLQPEHARRHHFFAGLQPGSDRDEVTSRLTKLDKLFSDPLVLFSLLILHVCNDENRIAVRRIVDSGRRYRYDVLPVVHQDTYFCKHARTQLPIRIRKRRMDLNVPSRLIHERVDRCDFPVERPVSKRIDPQRHWFANQEFAKILLR